MAAMTQTINFTSRPAVQARSSSARSAVPVGRKAFSHSILSLRTKKVSEANHGLRRFAHDITGGKYHLSNFLQATRASKSLQVRAAQSSDEGLDVEQLVKDLQNRVRCRNKSRSSRSSAMLNSTSVIGALIATLCCSGTK